MRLLSLQQLVFSQTHVCERQLLVRRNFSVIHKRENFMSWFRSRKKEEAKVRKTKEIIQDIESGKGIEDTTNGSSSSKILKLDLTPENIIGRRKEEKIDLMNDIPWNNWLTDQKVKTPEELDHVVNLSCKEVLGDNFNINDPFPDLNIKFKFVKRLQATSGYPISDYELTVLRTPVEFRDYYLKNIISGKLLQFNEKEPNAIYLTQKSFNQPNIRVVERVSSKVQKEKFNSILQEVEDLKEREARDEIQRLRSQE